MQFTEQQISAVARVLSDRAAEDCGVDKDDNWKTYSENYLNDAHVALGAIAAAPQVVADELAFESDAIAWGDALNEASWEFVNVCPEKSATLFNHSKPSLRAAIIKYAERVRKNQTKQAAPVQAQEPVADASFPQAWPHETRIESAAAFLAQYSSTDMDKLLDYRVQPIIRTLSAMIGQWQQAAVNSFLGVDRAPVEPVAVPDGFEQVRFRFFKNLNADERKNVFKAFGVWPGDDREGKNIPHVWETLLLRSIFNIAAPAAQGDSTQAEKDVLAERRRQIDVEGRTTESDDRHIDCQLARAAATYALCTEPGQLKLQGITVWPWGPHWWKFTDYRRNLVKSGALIVAEIERVDRAAIAAKAAS